MLNEIIWPEAQLLAGVQRLAQLLGCELSPAQSDSEDFQEYAESMGAEALSLKTSYGELAQTLRSLCPGIIQIESLGARCYLLIAHRKGNKLGVLSPEGITCWYSIKELTTVICRDRGFVADTNSLQVLNDLGLSGKRLQDATELLMHQQFAQRAIEGLWLLRPHSVQGLKVAIRYEGLGKYALGFVAAHLAGRAALIGSVSLLGYAIAQSLWTSNLVLAWLLIMVTYWVFNALGQMCQVHLEIRLGLLIKRHLQFGALRLSPEAHAAKGPAKFLGQAMEADGLQHNALPGAFAAINAVIDIALGLVIALFIQQWLLSIFLLGCLALKGYFSVQYAQSYRYWARCRKQLSELTIEHMQGNRTRLLQASPSHWHKEEARRLQAYWFASVQMDKLSLRLQALIPGLWLIGSSGVLCVVIFLSLLPIVHLVALLGVILLVWQAWQVFADSAQQLVRSWNSWSEIQDLLNHDKKAGIQAHALAPVPENHLCSTLSANQITYSYSSAQTTLQAVNVHLQQGQQYLLQGESGSGKSTLLALLSGQINPQQGWILCNDRDLQSLGHRYWRNKVCWVPQYHDNYLFSAPLLFNLLLGRSWPPSQEDIENAFAVCGKLGLGPLLNKMPAGIMQSVGEMGWQLSQGERSRVFLARALLQKPDFLLLDESLGALDSATSLQILSRLKTEPSAILLCMHP
jgi:ATP-binding cassette subfamily B protein